MDKKKIAIIAGVSVAVVVGLILALSLIGKEAPVEQGGPNSVGTDITLTDAEKAEVESASKKFVQSLGNYGWYPDLIKNPQVAATDNNFDQLLNQEHTTAEDSIAALRSLTNSSNFDVTVNKQAYSIPFSVETSIEGDFTVPNSPIAEGSRTYVPVTIPIKSTVSYSATGIGYTDADGTWHDAQSFVQQFTFEGELNLQFGKSGGKWVVNGFNNTVGVLAVDPMTFSNGDLVSEYLATSSNQIPVNK